MKINFDVPVLGMDGTPAVSQDGKPFTVRVACIEALLTRYQDDLQLSGEEQLKRFHLAEKVWLYNASDFSAEDIALIKRLVAKNYGPLVVGRVYNAIDPTPQQ